MITFVEQIHFFTFMLKYTQYFQSIINRTSCIILCVCLAMMLLDLVFWYDQHPAWLYYLNFPIVGISAIMLVLALLKQTSFRTAFLVFIYSFTIFFYVPGFIDPALTELDTLSYFSKISTCFAVIFFAGLIGAGRQVLCLGLLNILMYPLLSWYFYTKQGVFHIDYMNLYCFIAIPTVIYFVFRHIDQSIGEQETNKQRLKEAEMEILQLRIKEENRRNHYLAVIQDSNKEFINRFLQEIDLILKEDDQQLRVTKIKNLRYLCNNFRYSTEKTENAQWQQHTNADFISLLQKHYPSLTNKEQYICSLIRINLSSKEIADLMNASVETIKWHRKRIRKKIQLNDTESLITILNGIGNDMPEATSNKMSRAEIEN